MEKTRSLREIRELFIEIARSWSVLRSAGTIQLAVLHEDPSAKHAEVRAEAVVSEGGMEEMT